MHASIPETCNALGAHTCIPDLEAVIISREIRIMVMFAIELYHNANARNVFTALGTEAGVGATGQDGKIRVWSEEPNRDYSLKT